MNRSSPGKDRAPGPNLWEEMKAHGSSIADEARWAKRSGRSANPKGKIVSCLRWALNLGLDAYEETHGGAERPTKQEVTLWATDRAGRLMSGTSRLRKDNKFYDFGFKIASDLKAAFSKGWSLGAGTTELLSPDVNVSLMDPNLAVPERYQGVFEVFLQSKMRAELRDGGSVLLEERGNQWVKPIYVPVHLLTSPDGTVVQKQVDPYGGDALSHGALAAMEKRGLFSLVSFKEPDGRSSRYAVAKPAAFDMLAAMYERERTDMAAFRKTAEWRRRQEAMRMAGYNPDSDISERFYADKYDRLNRYIVLLNKKIAEHQARKSPSPSDDASPEM
ncbi:MAG: hypothetical protein KC466_11950 [Myxococcales bacterium]|nr:hypothetical protein [Myxococcales bacterium]